MNVRELNSPDEYTPTPQVRYYVLRIEPDGNDWTVENRMVKWDEHGLEISTLHSPEVMDKRRLNDLQLFWQARSFFLIARCKRADEETLFFENREDRQGLVAQAATHLPESLEVWIHPTRDRAFGCSLPKAVAFSVRSADELAQADIGHSEFEVSERRGTLTAKVYWVNGQPSADAETRWQPVIERKVREFLQSNVGQSTTVFIRGMLEDAVRQGDDVRDLIMAGVDLAARLAALKAMDYQPMAEEP